MVTHDISEAICMSDKVIVLSKRPSVTKNIYEINFNNKDIPSVNKENELFNYYYNLIWKDLDNDEY